MIFRGSLLQRPPTMKTRLLWIPVAFWIRASFGMLVEWTWVSQNWMNLSLVQLLLSWTWRSCKLFMKILTQWSLPCPTLLVFSPSARFSLSLFAAHHILDAICSLSLSSLQISFFNAICSLSLLWKSQFECNLFSLSLSLHCTSHFECNLSSLSLHCTSYFEWNFGLEFLCGLIQFFNLLEADSSAPWTSAKDGSQGACFISTSTSPSVGSLSRLELRILCSGVTMRVSFSVLGNCTYQCWTTLISSSSSFGWSFIYAHLEVAFRSFDFDVEWGSGCSYWWLMGMAFFTQEVCFIHLELLFHFSISCQ